MGRLRQRGTPELRQSPGGWRARRTKEGEAGRGYKKEEVLAGKKKRLRWGKLEESEG